MLICYSDLSLLKSTLSFDLPSIRKQKAKEKRSRQSDLMSDFENLDVILGSYQRDNSEMQEGNSDNEMDERLNRQEKGLNQNDIEFRSYLNTNLSENSGLTVETSRAITSEISSQMSRKLEEMTCDLNTRILDAINTAIESRALPSIRKAVGSQNSVRKANLDLRSDGPHPNNLGQVFPQRDCRSNGQHPEEVSQVAQDAQKDFPRLIATSSNRINHHKENSVDSNQNDDEYSYDSLSIG